jgi:arginyl-tRNA synthetase
MNPRQLAEQIIAKLEVADLCAQPEIAGAGFINFRLTPEALAARFVALAQDTKLGVPQPALPKKFVIDFSSPNVAKPMHVGHIRSTILGDALARIAEFLGHSVVRDNHIGDWGTQFGMLLVGWKTLLDRAALERDPIGEMERMYKTVNAQQQEDATVREAARSELVKLQAGDAENLAIWKEMIRLSQAQFDTIYARLGIRFDATLGESFTIRGSRKSPPIFDSVDRARKRWGALRLFDRKDRKKEDPFLIQRDGQWVDVPALVQKGRRRGELHDDRSRHARHRLREWSPDEILYVTDGRQQHHFRSFSRSFRRWKARCRR